MLFVFVVSVSVSIFKLLVELDFLRLESDFFRGLGILAIGEDEGLTAFKVIPKMSFAVLLHEVVSTFLSGRGSCVGSIFLSHDVVAVEVVVVVDGE